MSGEQSDTSSSSDENSNPVSSCDPLEVVQKLTSQGDVEPLDFHQLNKHNTLFEHRLTDDDEIWMVQTPADIDVSTLADVSIDFDSTVSKLKCKVNKSRKRFNVHTMKDSPSNINLLLPSKKTKSFHSRTYPLNGRIIFQESLRVAKKKESSAVEIENEG